MMKRAITLLSLLLVAAPAGGAAAQQVAPALTDRPAWLGLSYEVRWVQEDSRCEPQVLVQRVVDGSPAARAGLRAGDAIVALDGVPVADGRLDPFAARLHPGDSVRVRVDRDGRVRDVLAIAERRPAQPPAMILAPAPGAFGTSTAPIVHLDGKRLVVRNVDGAPRRADGYWFATGEGRAEFRRLGSWSRDDVDARVVRLLECAEESRVGPAHAPRMDLRQVQRRADSLRVAIARRALEHQDADRVIVRTYRSPATPAGPAATRVGAHVASLEPELADYFPNVRQGLLVLRVDPDSPAARSGLRPGDVIVQGGARPLATAQELHALLSLPDPQPVQLRVVRKGRTVSVTMPRS